MIDRWEIEDRNAWLASLIYYREAAELWAAGRHDEAQAKQRDATREWMIAFGRDTTPRAQHVTPDARAVPAGCGEIYAGGAAAAGERGVAPAAAEISGERA